MNVDYIFYRAYTVYRNKKDSNPIYMACLVLSLGTFFLIVDAYVMLGLLIRIDLPFNKVLVPFIALGILFFYIKYYNKTELINEIIEKYKDENLKTKTYNGYLIVIVILLLILIPVMKGVIQHNLGIDLYQ